MPRSRRWFALLILTACGGSATEEPQPDTSDQTPPSVAIVSPAPGPVTGIVTLAVNATDNTALAFVRFRVNGALVPTIDYTEPYSFDWNTASYSSGLYEWTAVATDTAGNSTTSAGVTYTYNFPTLRTLRDP